MKLIKQSLLIATLILLTINYALAQRAPNVKWIKTPFWKAPQASELNMKIKPLEAELTSACVQYKDIIFSDDGQLNWPGQPKRVDRFRTSPLLSSGMNVVTFEANFEVENLLGNSALIEENVDLSLNLSIDEKKEILPLFTHLKATTGASILDINEFKIELVQNKQSYTKVSRDLGLEDSKISIVYNASGHLVFKMEGRDVACDLLQGNIKISAKTSSYVRLMKGDVDEMEDFYHTKLTPELNRILSVTNETTIIKAARLGYQMSRVLEEDLHQKDSEIISRYIKGLIDVLFIPKTLDASANMVEINKKKVIDLVSSIDSEPVTITISL